MASFDYVALDLAGRTRTGHLTAADEAAAREVLERRRLAGIRLSPGKAKAGSAGLFGGRLDARSLALVTRQLATLVAVAPLEEALRTIAVQAEKPAVRNALMGVHGGVLEGYRLSDAMARQGRAFPPLYRAMVAAGEGSGALPSILERLADLLERDQQAQSKVTAALVYPAVLAATALLVVLALMTFVVPKVVDQFESMGQTLPLLTRLVIGTSEAIRSYGLVMLLVLVVAGFVAARALRRPDIRMKADALMLRLPILGRLIRDLHAARLARTLSTMIASGLPILEGLQITAPTIHNHVLRQATVDMAEMIREGGALSVAMRKVAVFPPLLVYMTASGENSGRVELMLGRAAEYMEREFATFTAVALSLLEPAIIILMGGLVAVIVLSILLPILQINTLAMG
ncbi:MAG: type II secretion system inner membrane protein GspF [Phenylobacterium sp.]|uniref:type II secretion system inner membrane protein GspF n=1 Tax=Phenylobacterium sp. TaxID=1871053 RepID=UPI0027371B0A|nr:type II secretion system inner membrane protein GspF [Phenylobacterium sp.]MDP1643784.1 type II secretion system inner membrane protein GspF [Phenylobacterium sp.]MDP3116675.1 type II secretion system inner membrane protein GspF [Phenylobacterium sp.]